ncbi:MAG: hypothetical protein ACE5EQ_12610 [Phycisphaerae bacterium]
MEDHKTNSEHTPDLLGYHLGLLDAAERARIETAYNNEQALRSDCTRLQHVLAPLDADTIDPAPDNLVQRVLNRVNDEAARSLPLPGPAVASSMNAGFGPGAGPFVTMREFVGIAAAILVFVGIFIPGYQTARREAQKIGCGNNMFSLGSAFSQYSEENQGHLPFAGPVRGDAGWYQTGGKGRSNLRNSRHPYRLVRGLFLLPKRFVCQGSEGDVPMRDDRLDAYNDFPDPRNNSYATQFVTAPIRRNTLLPNIPIAADMTPLVNPDRRLIRGMRIRRNSPYHHGGQNVLRVDGRVGFFDSPDVGVDNDDIYRVQNVFEYRGDERPVSANDAFLVP